ncbi:MAG: FIST N-terminal domain-containing protein [Mariprofundaceae bacterium]
MMDRLGDAPPALVLCAANADYDPEALRSCLTALAPDRCAIAGMSSCLGAMNDQGFVSADGGGLSLIGFSDTEGAYGAAVVPQADAPEVAASQAVLDAIAQSGRTGEAPALVWVSAAPGAEEQVLGGVTSVVGEHVPVLGGSSAGNDIAGGWWQFSGEASMRDGVLAVVMYPGCQIGFSFQSGYAPTSSTGLVTRAEGRVIHTIDGEPAATVYNCWTQGLIEHRLRGGPVLAETTLHPLGVVAGHVAGMPSHALIHPEQVLEDGALRMFAEVEEGVMVTLMQGSRESLQRRMTSIAQSVVEREHWHNAPVHGALGAFCAGCMLAMRDRLPNLAGHVRNALGGAPFQCVFTFGEQGCFSNSTPRHANLMMSIVVFAE